MSTIIALVVSFFGKLWSEAKATMDRPYVVTRTGAKYFIAKGLGIEHLVMAAVAGAFLVGWLTTAHDAAWAISIASTTVAAGTKTKEVSVKSIAEKKKEAEARGQRLQVNLLYDRYNRKITTTAQGVPSRSLLDWRFEDYFLVTVDAANVRRQVCSGMLTVLDGYYAAYAYTRADRGTILMLPGNGKMWDANDQLGFNVEYALKKAGKAVKYITRVIAPHPGFVGGWVPDHVVLEAPTTATDGGMLMGLSDARRTAQGSGLRTIRVGDILKITVLTVDGLIKGHALVVPDNWYRPGLITYEIKTEIKANSVEDQFTGILGFADGKDYVMTDMQSAVNFQYDWLLKEDGEKFVETIRAASVDNNELRKIMGIYSDLDHDNEMDWTLARWLKTQKDLRTPWIINRIIDYFLDRLLNTDNLRMPTDRAVRRYLFFDPTAIDYDGNLKPNGGVLKAGDCYLGQQYTGPVPFHRQPNAEGEFYIQNAVTGYLDGLGDLEGNALFLSMADWSEVEHILDILGGGDMDDAVVCPIDSKLVRHFEGLQIIDPSERAEASTASTGLDSKRAARLARVKMTYGERTLRSMDSQLGQSGNIGFVVNAMMQAKALVQRHKSEFWGFNQEAVIDADVSGDSYGTEIAEIAQARSYYDSMTQIAEFMAGRAPKSIKKKIEEGLVTKVETEIDRSIRKVKEAREEMIDSLRDEMLSIEYPAPLYGHDLPQHVTVATSTLRGEWREFWEAAHEAYGDRLRRDDDLFNAVYKDACAVLSEVLADFNETEKLLIAADMWTRIYVNNSPERMDEERLADILMGTSGYGDAILYTPGAMADLTMDMLEATGNGYYNRKVEFYATHKVIMEETVVTVANKTAKIGNTALGEVAAPNGKYTMVKGWVQVPTRFDRLAKKAGSMTQPAAIVNGWGTLIKAGMARELDVKIWKTANLGKEAQIVETEYDGKPAYEVHIDGYKMGSIARTDHNLITSKTVIVREGGRYNLLAFAK